MFKISSVSQTSLTISEAFALRTNWLFSLFLVLLQGLMNKMETTIEQIFALIFHSAFFAPQKVYPFHKSIVSVNEKLFRLLITPNTRTRHDIHEDNN